MTTKRFILITLTTLLFSCSKSDQEILKLLADIKTQNDNLKTQVNNLQKTTDSLTTILKNTNANVLNLDKKVDSIKNQLSIVLTQINIINTQIGVSNANIIDLQNKLIELQKKCDELSKLLNDYLSLMPQKTVSDGLIGFWPFNGNANDESGNSRNGITNGQTILNPDRFGSNSKCYSLQNIDDKITVTSQTPLNLTNKISISLWLLKPEFYDYSSLYLITNGTRYTNGFFIGLDQNNLSSGPDKYRIIFNISSNNSVYSDIPKSQIQNWTHVVGVYDGSQIKLYINAQLVSTLNYSGSINSPNGNLIFANWDNPSLPSTTLRKIDDIRLYNRALTNSEIDFLYKN